MLRKKEFYTVITPIPGFIPRQLAIDILHSHREVITLNPLVLDVKEIKAPRDAPSEEFFSTWYEITERLQIVPGMGKLGSSLIKFNGCFHDMPWGLQSHVYAPLNIDMRSKYRVAGNQPGVEPPEPQEMGLAALGAPKDGLYLREDIEFKCNITMVGVVKAGMKTASREMVDRIIKKAELLDAGVLQAMIEDGKLKTIHGPQGGNGDGCNGGGSDYTGGLRAASISSPPVSPGAPSPNLPYQVPRPVSMQHQRQGSRPGSVGSSQPSPGYMQYQQQQGQAYHQNQNPLYAQDKVQQFYAELPSSSPQVAVVPGVGPTKAADTIPMELPGDYQYYEGYQPQPQQQQQQQTGGGSLHHSNSNASSHYSAHNSRTSASSPDPNSGRWSHPQSLAPGNAPPFSPSAYGSRPSSLTASEAGSNYAGGFASPGLPNVKEEEAGGGGGRKGAAPPYPY